MLSSANIYFFFVYGFPGRNCRTNTICFPFLLSIRVGVCSVGNDGVVASDQTLSTANHGTKKLVTIVVVYLVLPIRHAWRKANLSSPGARV